MHREVVYKWSDLCCFNCLVYKSLFNFLVANLCVRNEEWDWHVCTSTMIKIYSKNIPPYSQIAFVESEQKLIFFIKNTLFPNSKICIIKKSTFVFMKVSLNTRYARGPITWYCGVFNFTYNISQIILVMEAIHSKKFIRSLY